MADMLVKLYALPPQEPSVARCEAQGVLIRRAMAHEKSFVQQMIREEFHTGWVDETDVAFSRQPIACVIATFEKRVIGFAAYEATARGYFGPTGVRAAFRKRGIGQALLVAAMHGLKEMGYAYAIIGGAAGEAEEFYAKSTGAILIPDSSPGIYREWLTS